MAATPESQAIPLVWMSKTDLLYVQPDLASTIDALTEAEMAQLAKTISDVLQETYRVALEQALLYHLETPNRDLL